MIEDRLFNAPIGTKAPAVNGGHWKKTLNWWKWCTGSTFPRPGGDWTGELIEPDEYYLQDSRGYVGNDVLWWAKDGKGYTTDLSKAHVYTKEDAVKQHESRITDIPWPKEYIDAKTRPAVDMQYIKRDEALAGTGIEIKKEKPLRKDVFNCVGCGRFISENQRYGCDCPNCETNNRP